jgi:hypothetical protein
MWLFASLMEKEFVELSRLSNYPRSKVRQKATFDIFFKRKFRRKAFIWYLITVMISFTTRIFNLK